MSRWMRGEGDIDNIEDLLVKIEQQLAEKANYIIGLDTALEAAQKRDPNDRSEIEKKVSTLKEICHNETHEEETYRDLLQAIHDGKQPNDPIFRLFPKESYGFAEAKILMALARADLGSLTLQSVTLSNQQATEEEKERFAELIKNIHLPPAEFALIFDKFPDLFAKNGAIQITVRGSLLGKPEKDYTVVQGTRNLLELNESVSKSFVQKINRENGEISR